MAGVVEAEGLKLPRRTGGMGSDHGLRLLIPPLSLFFFDDDGGFWKSEGENRLGIGKECRDIHRLQAGLGDSWCRPFFLFFGYYSYKYILTNPFF